MISKITYQNYLDELAHDKFNCLISGLGNEKRNSFDVIRDYINNMKNVDCFVFLIGPNNGDFSDEIYKMMKAINSKVILINYDNTFKLNENALREFVQYIDGIKDVSQVLFDVTGIDRENMLILLHLLKNAKSIEVSITSISGNYGAHVISNYLPPNNVRFFEGLPQITVPTIMILLPGYEEEANRILLNWYHPIRLYIGYGKTPVEKGQQIKERKKIDNIINDYTGNLDIEIKEFIYNAVDPEETASYIDNIISNDLIDINSNVIIASTSTKLATIGVFLICEKYKFIQLVNTRGIIREDLTKDILNVCRFDMPKD